MRKATSVALSVVALVAFFYAPFAHAGVVYNGYAGSDNTLVTGSKYPAVCWTMPATVVVNSVSVGLGKASNPFILQKLVGPYVGGVGVTIWTFGASDTMTVSSEFQTVATSTRTFTLYSGAQYCVYTGTNSGTERFYGSATDGAKLSNSIGNTNAEVIGNTTGVQVSYFGSSNVWLCDKSESTCGGSAPTAGITLPGYPTSTSALGAWFSSAVSVFNTVPPWSYWVQVRTVLNDDRSLLTSASSTPYNSFLIGASTTPLHFTVSLFTESQFTTLIPLWLWTIIKYMIASVMWIEFALMIYYEVDRRFTKSHS